MKREIDMKQKNETETAQETNEPKVCWRWHRPAQLPAVHGMGRYGACLVDGCRRTDFEGAGGYDKFREEEDGRGLLVRTDQRQSYRLQ